jgi:hypothetical protein
MVGFSIDKCWVCGKPVLHWQFEVDEFGFAFHPSCAAQKDPGKKSSASEKTKGRLTEGSSDSDLLE